MKKIVKTTLAPEAIGPYSQAVETNGILFISGQIPVDPASNQVVNNEIKTQTRQVLNNLGAILDEAGYTRDHVVKCTCFLKNMNDFTAMNEVYGNFFNESPPARAAFEVARLPKDVLIEIDAIAIK